MKNKRMKRKQALMAALALVCIGTGGLVGSGAYFTDQKAIPSNTLQAARVELGAIGITDNSLVTTKNLLPLTNAVATAADSQSSLITVNVKNTSNVAIGWAASINGVTGNATTFLPKIQLQWHVGAGAWSTPTTLDAFGALTTSAITGTGLVAGDTTVVEIRLWLKDDSATSLQGLLTTYNVRVRAMQNYAPLDGVNEDGNYAVLRPH